MTDLTHWVFNRFKSERSGKYRMTVRGDTPDGERKVTSVLVSVDANTGIVTTVSGSTYRLVGPWMYATAGGSPETLADILAWYGKWTPANPADYRKALLALLSDGPAFTEADPGPVVDDVSELARRCGLVADIKGRDEDEWAYLVEDTGAVRIAHTSWWDRERDEKREPGWAIFEDWRLFATIEDAVRAYAADHTLQRVGARITAPT